MDDKKLNENNEANWWFTDLIKSCKKTTVWDSLSVMEIEQKNKKKKKKYVFDTFVDIDYINCIMYMYSCGTYIRDISNYTGLHEDQINVVIDAYNDCL